MSVVIRPKRKPVNRVLLVGGCSAIAAWSLLPAPDTSFPADACFWMFAAATVGGFWQGFKELHEDYHLRAAFAESERVTEDHGSAREASWAEVVRAGMADPESGNFLGLYQGRAPVFAPPKTPFSLVEMPPGAGKTVNCVIGSILHRARLGASIVVADPKLELGVMLGPKLREQGYEVWFANPTQGFAELCGDVELNPYQGLLDAVHAKDESRRDAPKFAADYAELHYPTDKSERNPYFSHGSRRTILTASLYLALVDPGHCTPTDVYRLLVDPQRITKALKTVRDSLQSPRKDDPLVDFLRGEAANLLDRADKNEENFGAFLEGATQRLLPFNQAGRIAGYGRTAVHNIAELRERQVILFIMTPLSHMRDLGAFTSCLNHNIIAACKDHPSDHPVHIVGEEARRAHNAALSKYQSELARLNRDVEKMIQAICDGFANEALKIKFNAADARIKELKRLIEEADEAPPALHPNMADRYRKELRQLVKALNDKKSQAEASTLIRDLVERVVLTPNVERSELMIDLHGDLAGILNVANGRMPVPAQKRAKAGPDLDAETLEDVVVWAKIKMVAGAGFEPAAFRL